MTDHELLVTSCRSSMQLWTGLSSGSTNNVHSYRVHGCIETSSLNIIGNEYVMVSEQSKPLLHVWPIAGTEENTSPRLVLPEPARAVCVSPDNCYLAVGISKKLYIWQVCSGILLSAQEVHLSPITCIKFSSNSECLITGATNGSVLVYTFSNLTNVQETFLVQKEKAQIKALYNILDHISAVTNIHVGGFSTKSRFITSSLDNTCRLYELFTGQPLLQLVCKEGISMFTIDDSFWNLYLGALSGTIQQFSLMEPPRSSMHHISDTDNKLFFVGHTQRINCLVLNITNDILVSGSEDKLVVIWDIESSDVARKPKIIISELHRTIILNTKNFEVSTLQGDNIVFNEDNDYDKDRKVSNISLEDKLLTAYSINERLYSHLAKMIANRDGVR